MGGLMLCPVVAVLQAAVTTAVPAAVDEPVTSAHRPDAWLRRVRSEVGSHWWAVEPSQAASTRAVPAEPLLPAGITYLPCTHNDPSRRASL